MATSRRKKNTISQLKDESGSFNWKNGLSDLIVNYYNNLFKTQQGPSSVIIDIVDRIVSDEINEDLKRPVTVEEIKHVVFSMNPDKAPGPDGLNPSSFDISGVR